MRHLEFPPGTISYHGTLASPVHTQHSRHIFMVPAMCPEALRSPAACLFRAREDPRQYGYGAVDLQHVGEGASNQSDG